VGLGPGDPDLATVKALRLVQEADIVFSLSEDILDRFHVQFKGKNVRDLSGQNVTRYHARKDNKIPEADKSPSGDQGRSNRSALIREVRQALAQGKKVVFVDSGDPLIYGPWAWMLEEFKDVDLEVVPGVSSFNAGLAALKRDGTWAPHTHSIILTTDRPNSDDKLEALAAHKCSMAIFTHRTNFSEIMRKLKTQYAEETPVAVVFYAGYKEKQSVIRGSLTTIESMIKAEILPLEHIVFVGDFLTFSIDKKQEGQ